MATVVPDSLMEEMEQLQESFSRITGQAIVLTDQEGNVFTRPVAPGMFYEVILTSLQNIDNPFKPTLRRLGPLSHPVILEEWIPGLKYAIIPLFPGYGQVYYLWSGIYMQEGTKALVMPAFEAKMKNHPVYEHLCKELLALPELSRERIAEVRDKIAVLGRILSKLLSGCAGASSATQGFGDMISGLLMNLEKGYLKVEEVLQQLAATPSAGDLYAFAKENEAGEFQVKYAAGKGSDQLMNAAFQQGDGFLGQAALGKEPRHWRTSAMDPRSLFFTQRGLPQPEYLSCYPAMIYGGRRALLLTVGFGKSEHIQNYDPQEQCVASLLGISDRGQKLIRREELRKEGTLILKEAVRLLPLAASHKELGSQLIDTVMSMPFSPASVLVFFQNPTADQSTYYARGWPEAEEPFYVKDLKMRYSPQAFLSGSVIHETSGERFLLECPLIAENVYKGILSIGFRKRIEAQEWRAFMECIATLATTAIRLLEKDSRYAKQAETFLNNLLQNLQYHHPELQRISLEASNMAYDFARYAGLPEKESERLKLACKLAPFPLEVLMEYDFYIQEVSLLNQVDQLSAFYFEIEKPMLSFEAQLLALVLHHAGKQEQAETLKDNREKGIVSSRFHLDINVKAVIDAEPRVAFQSFLLSRSGEQRHMQPVSPVKLLNNTSLKSPKEEWGISPREEEVLELIILGKTNKDIAAALFISEHTVKNHLSRIFDKMNVSDRSQIIALIYKRILSSERIEI
ncbi:helix-turn-helix transcriptional regulator [Paenibacillus helianthi]|nr:LuxR C-terminal-related transcriptional regulator [Paenibacillus helianthi]